MKANQDLTDLLREMREQSDALGDRTVARIRDRGKLSSVNELFDHLIRNGDLIAEEFTKRLGIAETLYFGGSSTA